MEIKENEVKESLMPDLHDSPFNHIEPERDITYEEASAILERYRRPPLSENPHEHGRLDFSESGEPIFVTQKEKAEKADRLLDAKETEERDASERKGGRYGDIFKEGEGDTTEVHHMPADSVSPLERSDGPAIKMDKEDHRKTASCGNSRDAREYRAKQKDLIEKGKFREAVQMDIDDIHEKFGDKYDDAIAERMEHVDKVEAEGKING